MATSGSTDYIVTADDIITDALKVTTVLKVGQAASTDQITDGLRLLNLLAKHWQTDGLQLWARKRATILLELNKNTYNLGSTGDHATASYTETAMKVAGAATDSTIDVDSITGLTSGDYIGIELDDGTIHWTTINGAPAGDTVTITTALPSAAAIDKAVYAYTTKIGRPLRILEMWRRDSSDSDIPVNVQSLEEYATQNSKTEDGKIVSVTYDPQLTNGKLYVWPEADNVTDSLEFWYHRPFEDFDASTDNPDFPQEWYLALVYGLAALFCDVYANEIEIIPASRVNKKAKEFKKEVMDFSVEDTSWFFHPEWQDR